MTDKLSAYREADRPLPKQNRLWPLYGAGFENLGQNGGMIERPLPAYGADELLVRHDATGICFSDIKVIRAGQNHPRIYRQMREEPVVLGHEISLTVVGVGEDLRDQYTVGDRFIVQADIYVKGVGYAYGYELQGGFSQYNVIDQRVLNGDGGNYLLPIQPTTGYAEAALAEPWACVEASYTVAYRQSWKPGGRLLITGDGAGVTLGRAEAWRPASVALDTTDAAFAEQVRAWANAANIAIAGDEVDTRYDDIVVLGNEPERIEAAYARLARGGMCAVITNERVARRVSLDIGRLHYDNLAIVGAPGSDLSAAYAPIRTQLLAGGITWILGAGGPMGHMHLQRAIEIAGHPRKIVATNLNRHRILAVKEKFTAPAKEAGIQLVCYSQDNYAGESEMESDLRHENGGAGFDDIAVMAPSIPAIELAMNHLADNGVMNVFAGVPRGTQARFTMNDIVFRGVRFTGTSGSSIEDLAHMRDLIEGKQLATNKSVNAVAGLEGVKDGLAAVSEGRFPGKVVIFPNLAKPLPLTPLADLQAVLPSVYAKLGEGESWTVEAEAELLRLLL